MNAHALFDETSGQYSNSPPLPPTPPGEVALEVFYGSKTTRVTNVPLNQPGSPQDFMPMLPPRPMSSIHPSSRGIPTSPIRPGAEIPTSPHASTSAPSPPSSPSTVGETDDSLSYHI